MSFKHEAVDPLAGSTSRTKADPKKVIEVTAFLGYSDTILKTVPEIAGKSVEARSHWSQKEMEDVSDMDDFVKLGEWAADNNLTVYDANIGARTSKVKGSVKDLEKAFGVKIVEYKNKDSGDYFTYEGTVKLPEFVYSIHGLDNRRVAEHHLVKGRKPAAGTGFKAPDVAKAYNFPNGTGSGQTVGIIELGGGFTAADLQNYWKLIGIPSVDVTAVSVDGATNTPQPGRDSSDIEVELDVEIPASFATGAEYVVYFAPNTDQGFIDAITTAAHDITHKPSVISISWGGPESSWSTATIAAMGQAFQACAAMGISVFAASGDAGNTDGAKGLNVDYPASDPFVTGCGATDITSLSPLTENGWQYAGGGASRLFAAQPWQIAAIPGTTKRNVPDVAGLGGSPGFIVITDGQTMPVEGTSCVAPLWAGLIAIINSQIGKNVGFLNPIIYKNPGAFQDITTGNNGFPAGPGWDPLTGLGTPNGQMLLKVFQGGIQPPNTLTVPSSLSYHVQENKSIAITLTASDNISGITSIQYGIITPPKNGTLVAISGSTALVTAYSYNPNTDYVGSDLFDYQATDNIGTKSNIGAINLTVAGTVVAQSRYQLRLTHQKGEPVPDSSWQVKFDSGVLK